MDTPHHASRNAIGPESRELLAEFVAQADMAATTIAKYDAQLREFARWLQHPRSRLIGDDDPRALAAATPRDVARFLAYLRSTDRYAATWTITRRSPLSASARKSHVASVDDHDDAGIGGRGDERHAQFSVAEEKRREAISSIVPQDARGEPRPDLERPRLAGSRAVCHQRSGSEICANLISGRALHACSDAS